MTSSNQTIKDPMRWAPLRYGLLVANDLAFGLFIDALLEAKRVEDIPKPDPVNGDYKFAAEFWKAWAGALLESFSKQPDTCEPDHALYLRARAAGVVPCEEPK